GAELRSGAEPAVPRLHRRDQRAPAPRRARRDDVLRSRLGLPGAHAGRQGARHLRAPRAPAPRRGRPCRRGDGAGVVARGLPRRARLSVDAVASITHDPTTTAPTIVTETLCLIRRRSVHAVVRRNPDSAIRPKRPKWSQTQRKLLWT